MHYLGTLGLQLRRVTNMPRRDWKWVLSRHRRYEFLLLTFFLKWATLSIIKWWRDLASNVNFNFLCWLHDFFLFNFCLFGFYKSLLMCLLTQLFAASNCILQPFIRLRSHGILVRFVDYCTCNVSFLLIILRLLLLLLLLLVFRFYKETCKAYRWIIFEERRIFFFWYK